ncbi:MAG: extracellular solute-binding protein [Actinomycetota bacterium]|nr:extracellular solute-binding protein [Actinomycetota bacterium]
MVRKLKRAVPITLSLGGIAVLAAACGGGGSTGATKSTTPAKSFAGQSLTVLDGAPTGADAHQMQQYYNDIARLFHKRTGATLHWDYYASPANEVTTVETSTVSGSGPDVISYGTSFVGTLWATGDFAPLSQKDWKVLGGQGSFIKADLFDSGVSPSKSIGVPNETNPFTLVYNTADFKKAGITSPPKTWTQLVNDAKQIQSKVPGVSGLGIDPSDPYDPWKSIYFLNLQMGGKKWVSANAKQVRLDTPTMRQAVNFYFSLYSHFHIVPKQALGWNGAEMGSAFDANKVAMVIIGGYGYKAAAVGTPAQGHVGFALLPTIPYGHSTLPKGAQPIETETTGNYWAIPKYAAKKEQLALAFEKITLSRAIQLDQFKLLGWIPVNHAGVKAVESYSKTAVPFVKAESSALPTSVAPVWSYVETGMETAIGNIASHMATSGGWSSAYADQQLSTAQATAAAHT